jgi:beta-lactamase regulating signal transducer with metallopeptidase domain
VLRHERVHLRLLHPLQLLIARSLAAALPFLPLLHELAEALPRAQELAADRAVIRAGERRALGRALIALMADQAVAPPIPLAAGMVGSLDARLDQLTGDAAPPPSLSRRALLHTVLAFGAALVVLTLSVLGHAGGPAAPPGSPALALARLSLPWHCLAVATIFTVTVQALRTAVARVHR